ncbi:hypothetical protein EVAR_34262_1 [Eumeta japonica]|uniref:Uncharacterized protein n=1 Tax=Eumeta variegata TaxID=151549 RepID=A0A4C1VVT6_EUMVA|nr:hypothetical protein EVAR_34262_1 [Eumeta japonica]
MSETLFQTFRCWRIAAINVAFERRFSCRKQKLWVIEQKSPRKEERKYQYENAAEFQDLPNEDSTELHDNYDSWSRRRTGMTNKRRQVRNPKNPTYILRRSTPRRILKIQGIASTDGLLLQKFLNIIHVGARGPLDISLSYR